MTSGPFGVIAAFLTYCPGQYSLQAPSITALATLNANGQTALAVLDPGMIFDTSGGVVFLSDMNIFDAAGPPPKTLRWSSTPSLSSVLKALTFQARRVPCFRGISALTRTWTRLTAATVAWAQQHYTTA